MERVHIDLLGPLPKTAAGNEHILMMVDQFTKWVEIIALPSQTAEITARAAVNEFFTRFGCPFHLFSDQGRNFESKLFAALCDALQIQKTRTTPLGRSPMAKQRDITGHAWTLFAVSLARNKISGTFIFRSLLEQYAPRLIGIQVTHQRN